VTDTVGKKSLHAHARTHVVTRGTLPQSTVPSIEKGVDVVIAATITIRGYKGKIGAHQCHSKIDKK
jgi:hypothetical protein